MHLFIMLTVHNFWQVKAKAAEIEEAVYGPKAPPTSSSPATTPTASESTAASQPGIFLPDDVIKKSIEKKVGTKVYRALCPEPQPGW